MRRLTYYVATTLDGFIAGPDGGDPSGQPYFEVGPDLVEFIATHYPETLPAPARAALGIEGPGRVFDTVLEGRGSYQIGLDAGLDDAYPHLRHLVFSTTLGGVGGDVELVGTDPVQRVRELKAEDGLDLWLVGGGRLAHSLLPEIDRLVLKVNPSVIGSGIPLFVGGFSPALFSFVASEPLPSGVQVLTLDRRR
ncbi:dihydrofolate reductase [Desertihabitans brevis]|uniref:Dihydrofolate reductase n=1 Tax=Desertihabitans brevis TaxID=2268447 RepID=A0A367YVN1_9ACTN|nr:dihydrofolate reductase family protein [Desertihabitans brevis]RCK69933.1 dihydrofolate reductase [Desertihabitans brevis]